MSLQVQGGVGGLIMTVVIVGGDLGHVGVKKNPPGWVAGRIIFVGFRLQNAMLVFFEI